MEESASAIVGGGEGRDHVYICCLCLIPNSLSIHFQHTTSITPDATPVVEDVVATF